MAADATCAVDMRVLSAATEDFVTMMEIYSSASGIYDECIVGNPSRNGGAAVRVGGLSRKEIGALMP